MKNDPGRTDLQSRDFPVREDMDYQLKVWRFERCGWYVLVLLVLLGLLGVFSRGVLSSKDVVSENEQLRVEYEMFHRNGASNSMKITVTGLADTAVELEFEGDLLNGFSVESFVPEPSQARSSSEGMRLWVHTDKRGQARLYITLRSDGLGLFQSRVSTPGSEGIALNQFIFP